MAEFMTYFTQNLAEIVIPLAIFLTTLAAGYALRRLLFRQLSYWAKKTETQAGNLVIGATKTPSLIWALILATYLGLRFSELPESVVDVSGKILLILGIISVTLFLANLVSRLVQAYLARAETALLPVSSLMQNIIRGIIFLIGILVILGSLGIEITPLLATLGVGGLAVALALQDTLANLFAGFYIAVTKQISIGDYIKLDSGEEGYVTDIHWRATKIKMLANNVVLVPNEKLAKAIVTDYYLPEKEMAVLVNLGVHYNSDLRKVEGVTVEVAREVMKEVQGGVPEFEPFIRYHTFGDFSINFTVILRAREFVDQYLIKHEFIKRLHERYKAEGVIIPYPIRAMNYEQEKAMTP